MCIDTISAAPASARSYASRKAPTDGWEVVGRRDAAFMRAKKSAWLSVPSANVSSPIVTDSGTTVIPSDSRRSSGMSAVLSVKMRIGSNARLPRFRLL